MSTSLSVYAVDFAKLQHAFGCKDVDLLRAIQDENADQLEEDERRFDEEKAEGEPELRAVLSELVQGELLHFEADYEHQYHFAIVMLVEHFGALIEMVEGGGPSGGTARMIDPLLVKHGFPPGFSSLQLFEGGPPQPYPKFSQPAVGHLGPAEIRIILSGLKPIDIMGADKAAAAWMLRIISWMRVAATEDKGLVLVWS